MHEASMPVIWSLRERYGGLLCRSDTLHELRQNYTSDANTF